jgi:hypothetical protein
VGDDPAGALLDADQSAERVDIHDRVPVGLGNVEQVHRAVEAGVVEEHVQPASVADERVERRGHLAAVTHVRGQGERGSPLGLDLALNALGGLDVEVQHPDRRTFTGESNGEGPAQATAGTGEDDGGARDASCHSEPSRAVRSASRLRGPER